MAAAGDNWGKVLNYSEWRSQAVLAYIDESKVGSTRLLMDSLQASHDEDEAAGESVTQDPWCALGILGCLLVCRQREMPTLVDYSQKALVVGADVCPRRLEGLAAE